MTYPDITQIKMVNPLQLLLGQLMKNNLVLVRLKPGTIPVGTPVGECLAWLDRAMPAGTAYLLFGEAEANLLQFDSSSVRTGETTAFTVRTGAELDTVPVDAERLVAGDGPF